MINILQRVYLLRPITVEELVKGETMVATTQLAPYHFNFDEDPPLIRDSLVDKPK